MAAKLDVSVVVPLYNECESLPELMAWIDRVCSGEKLSYEVIMVDDGSNDGSWVRSVSVTVVNCPTIWRTRSRC